MVHLFSRLLAAIALCATLPTHAAPGDLDTAGFGSGFGKVITAIGTSDDTVTALALQADGKIVVAGYCVNGNNNYDFCLARYLPSGALDTSFNSTGKVTTAIGSGNDTAYAVALQPDGKIVVAGYCFSASTNDFCLARYLASGALDTSFNTTGKVITAIGLGSDAASTLALQPDGKIVVAGTCSNVTSYDFCLARYLTSGALDTSFNTTGKVITVIGPSYDDARALALQTDGKILVAGTCVNGNTDDFCLTRYLPSGAIDTSFNTTGKVITAIGTSNDNASALALQPDGKIVVAGHCWNGSNNDFCLARYLPSGALDTSFNTTGKVTTAIGTSNDNARALALQPDGKIVVAGECSNGSTYDFCLARFLPSGALDTSLNSTGKVITAIGAGNDYASALAQQPDGKIVVAGTCSNGINNDFCLARYEGGPFDARNCSTDIDGDNQVLATTDSLIHARIALGLTGNAAIGGITFAGHATRTTWPAIRDYLVSQCGMSIVP